MESKTTIRKRILEQRSSLALAQQKEKSLKIQKTLLRMDCFYEANHVLLYMSCRGEVQTDLLIKECLVQNKTIGIPKVHGEFMTFYRLKNLQDTTEGYFHIQEPISHEIVEPENALVIVPGVAFTRTGYRLGYGKGFYDRYLSSHPKYNTCGLAYECQIVEEIPMQEHDVRIHRIISESQIY